MTPEIRQALSAFLLLSAQSRATLLRVLRKLQVQPVYAKEHTHAELLRHIATRCDVHALAEIVRQEQSP